MGKDVREDVSFRGKVVLYGRNTMMSYRKGDGVRTCTDRYWCQMDDWLICLCCMKVPVFIMVMCSMLPMLQRTAINRAGISSSRPRGLLRAEVRQDYLKIASQQALH